MNKYQRINK